MDGGLAVVYAVVLAIVDRRSSLETHLGAHTSCAKLSGYIRQERRNLFYQPGFLSKDHCLRSPLNPLDLCAQYITAVKAGIFRSHDIRSPLDGRRV